MGPKLFGFGVDWLFEVVKTVIELNDVPVEAFFFVVTEPEFGVGDSF